VSSNGQRRQSTRRCQLGATAISAQEQCGAQKSYCLQSGGSNTTGSLTAPTQSGVLLKWSSGFRTAS